jgi:hypothetical protein
VRLGRKPEFELEKSDIPRNQFCAREKLTRNLKERTLEKT